MNAAKEELFKSGTIVDDLFELFKDSGSRLNYKDQVCGGGGSCYSSPLLATSHPSVLAPHHSSSSLQAAHETMQEMLFEVRAKLVTIQEWLVERHVYMKQELEAGSANLGEASLAMLQVRRMYGREVKSKP